MTMPEPVIEEIMPELAEALETALVQAEAEGPLSRRFKPGKPYSQYLAAMEAKFANRIRKTAGENQYGWKSEQAMKEADFITNRFGVEPKIHRGSTVAVWEDLSDALPKVMVTDRQHMHVLPYPHYDIVNVAYSITIPPKIIKCLHRITSCATYMPDREALWISTESWAVAMVIAAVLRAFVEGHLTVHDARDSIWMLRDQIKQIPELLDAQEQYALS
jgi:hypothetical protein